MLPAAPVTATTGRRCAESELLSARDSQRRSRRWRGTTVVRMMPILPEERS